MQALTARGGHGHVVPNGWDDEGSDGDDDKPRTHGRPGQVSQTLLAATAAVRAPAETSETCRLSKEAPAADVCCPEGVRRRTPGSTVRIVRSRSTAEAGPLRTGSNKRHARSCRVVSHQPPSRLRVVIAQCKARAQIRMPPGSNTARQSRRAGRRVVRWGQACQRFGSPRPPW